MDYYSMLGVSKNASDKEIKTAFRKLAAKHHPDKGGDHKKFVEIKEAYEALSDPQKKSNYDQYGSTEPPQGFGPNGFQGMGGFEDVFANIFGNGFAQQQRRQMRNKDMRIGYRMHFKEVYTGTGATISYVLPSGRNEVIDVKIPAGMKHGDTVQFPNYGDDSIPNLQRGTLLVQLAIQTPNNWRRDGEHLYTELRVDIFDLLLGKNVQITTPEQKSIMLNIPPGTNNDVTMNITGHGVPIVNTTRRGNLYVKIKAITPKLTQDELQKVQEIKNGIDLRS